MIKAFFSTLIFSLLINGNTAIFKSPAWEVHHNVVTNTKISDRKPLLSKLRNKYTDNSRRNLRSKMDTDFITIHDPSIEAKIRTNRRMQICADNTNYWEKETVIGYDKQTCSFLEDKSSVQTKQICDDNEKFSALCPVSCNKCLPCEDGDWKQKAKVNGYAETKTCTFLNYKSDDEIINICNENEGFASICPVSCDRCPTFAPTQYVCENKSKLRAKVIGYGNLKGCNFLKKYNFTSENVTKICDDNEDFANNCLLSCNRCPTLVPSTFPSLDPSTSSKPSLSFMPSSIPSFMPSSIPFSIHTSVPPTEGIKKPTTKPTTKPPQPIVVTQRTLTPFELELSSNEQLSDEDYLTIETVTELHLFNFFSSQPGIADSLLEIDLTLEKTSESDGRILQEGLALTFNGVALFKDEAPTESSIQSYQTEAFEGEQSNLYFSSLKRSVDSIDSPKIALLEDKGISTTSEKPSVIPIVAGILGGSLAMAAAMLLFRKKRKMNKLIKHQDMKSLPSDGGSCSDYSIGNMDMKSDFTMDISIAERTNSTATACTPSKRELDSSPRLANDQRRRTPSINELESRPKLASDQKRHTPSISELESSPKLTNDHTHTVKNSETSYQTQEDLNDSYSLTGESINNEMPNAGEKLLEEVMALSTYEEKNNTDNEDDSSLEDEESLFSYNKHASGADSVNGGDSAFGSFFSFSKFGAKSNLNDQNSKAENLTISARAANAGDDEEIDISHPSTNLDLVDEDEDEDEDENTCYSFVSNNSRHGTVDNGPNVNNDHVRRGQGPNTNPRDEQANNSKDSFANDDDGMKIDKVKSYDILSDLKKFHPRKLGGFRKKKKKTIDFEKMQSQITISEEGEVEVSPYKKNRKSIISPVGILHSSPKRLSSSTPPPAPTEATAKISPNRSNASRNYDNSSLCSEDYQSVDSSLQSRNLSNQHRISVVAAKQPSYPIQSLSKIDRQENKIMGQMSFDTSAASTQPHENKIENLEMGKCIEDRFVASNVGGNIYTTRDRRSARIPAFERKNQIMPNTKNDEIGGISISRRKGNGISSTHLASNARKSRLSSSPTNTRPIKEENKLTQTYVGANLRKARLCNSPKRIRKGAC